MSYTYTIGVYNEEDGFIINRYMIEEMRSAWLSEAAAHPWPTFFYPHVQDEWLDVMAKRLTERAPNVFSWPKSWPLPDTELDR